MTGHCYSINNHTWPQWEEKLTRAEEVTLVVQVNGKLRDRIMVAPSVTEDEARKLALASPRVKAHLEGKNLTKMIYVPGKLINLVVR